MSAYKCPALYCNREFSQVEDALDHVNSHEKSQKGCVVPGCRYEKQTRLSHHTRKKHRSSCQYPCSSCNSVFVRSANRSQHANNGHCKCNTRVISAPNPFRSMFNFPHYTQPTSNIASQLSAMAIASSNEGRSSTLTANEATFNLGSETSVTDLNRFIVNQLQPNESFNSEMNQTVDEVCSFFRRKMSPREIFKSGSMGKGTAIKGNADIDLLLILPVNEVNSARQLKETLPAIENKIKEYLPNQQHPDFTVMQETIGTTKFAVQFTVMRRNEKIKVDLLPIFHFTDVDNLYEQMKYGPNELIPYYSASLGKLQVDFVNPIPANVKNLIRLVKYWRKEYVNAAKRIQLPNSYVLELITIHLWQSKGSPSSFDTLKAFHSVMETLVDNQSLRVIWSDNYNEGMIPEHIRYQRPLVMDPANPFNNICDTFSWKEIGKKANEALHSRMLRNVTSTTWS